MKKNEITSGFKLPKEIQERLKDKIISRNDDKIINLLEQRASHIEAIKRIDAEMQGLTSLNGLE